MKENAGILCLNITWIDLRPRPVRHQNRATEAKPFLEIDELKQLLILGTTRPPRENRYLEATYLEAKRNGGDAGSDGETFEAIEAPE